MPTGRRIQRLSHQLQSEISDIIKTRVKDPRIQGLITINNIKLSVDIKNAIIFTSVYGPEKSEQIKCIDGLNSAARYIQSLLAKRLRIKYIPNILFRLDDSIEKAFEVQKLIKEAVDGDDERN